MQVNNDYKNKENKSAKEIINKYKSIFKYSHFVMKGRNKIIFKYPFNNRKELKDIMYKSMISKHMINLLNDKTIKFINLDNVDLNFYLKQGYIMLIYKLYYYKPVIFDSSVQNEFNRMSCVIYEKNPNIKLSPCTKGNAEKIVFYNKAQDLKDYIIKLNNNKNLIQDHNDIFSIIEKWNEFRNHNMDVGSLHFK